MSGNPEFKPMRRDDIPAALARAAHYRELDESAQAESICHDILLADPDNQSALVLMLQTLCDRFGEGYRVDFLQALEILPQIRDPYERAFYAGFVCDHRANSVLLNRESGGRHDAYEYLVEAMACYEKAERLRPEDCDEARQRWNACARIISANGLDPWPVQPAAELGE